MDRAWAPSGPRSLIASAASMSQTNSKAFHRIGRSRAFSGTYGEPNDADGTGRELATRYRTDVASFFIDSALAVVGQNPIIAGAHRFMTGVHFGNRIRDIEAFMKEHHFVVETLEEHLLYADVDELRGTEGQAARLHRVSQIRALLAPLQRAARRPLLATAVLVSTPALRVGFGMNPWDLLSDVQPLHVALDRPRDGAPRGVPVIFQDGANFVLGWLTQPTALASFDITYEPLAPGSTTTLNPQRTQRSASVQRTEAALRRALRDSLRDFAPHRDGAPQPQTTPVRLNARDARTVLVKAGAAVTAFDLSEMDDTFDPQDGEVLRTRVANFPIGDLSPLPIPSWCVWLLHFGGLRIEPQTSPRGGTTTRAIIDVGTGEYHVHFSAPRLTERIPMYLATFPSTFDNNWQGPVFVRAATEIGEVRIRPPATFSGLEKLVGSPNWSPVATLSGWRAVAEEDRDLSAAGQAPLGHGIDWPLGWPRYVCIDYRPAPGAPIASSVFDLAEVHEKLESPDTSTDPDIQGLFNTKWHVNIDMSAQEDSVRLSQSIVKMQTISGSRVWEETSLDRIPSGWRLLSTDASPMAPMLGCGEYLSISDEALPATLCYPAALTPKMVNRSQFDIDARVAASWLPQDADRRADMPVLSTIAVQDRRQWLPVNGPNDLEPEFAQWLGLTLAAFHANRRVTQIAKLEHLQLRLTIDPSRNDITDRSPVHFLSQLQRSLELVWDSVDITVAETAPSPAPLKPSTPASSDKNEEASGPFSSDFDFAAPGVGRAPRRAFAVPNGSSWPQAAVGVFVAGTTVALLKLNPGWPMSVALTAFAGIVFLVGWLSTRWPAEPWTETRLRRALQHRLRRRLAADGPDRRAIERAVLAPRQSRGVVNFAGELTGAVTRCEVDGQWALIEGRWTAEWPEPPAPGLASTESGAFAYVLRYSTVHGKVIGLRRVGRIHWVSPLFEDLAELVAITGGTYTMGSTDAAGHAYDDERPAHPQTIPSFALGRVPVTVQAWQAVEASTPSERPADVRYPIANVSWFDAVKNLNRWSRLTGRLPCYRRTWSLRSKNAWVVDHSKNGFRLPTEQEWEFACRAGTKTAYWFGDDPANLDDHAWHGDNTDSLQPVAQKPPNPLGLHDMHGLIWEWCWNDWRDYPLPPTHETVPPVGDDARGPGRFFREPGPEPALGVP